MVSYQPVAVRASQARFVENQVLVQFEQFDDHSRQFGFEFFQRGGTRR